MAKSAAKSKARRTTSRRTQSVSLLSLFPGFHPSRFRRDTLTRRGTYVRELQDTYLHRGLVLYVGAGVSRSLGLPSWPELIRELGVTMMSRKVESAVGALQNLSDDAKWNRLAKLQVQVEKGTEADRPILMMARAVKDALEDRLPSAIARSLYRPVRGALSSAFRVDRRSDLATSKPWWGGRFPRRGLPTSDLLDAIISLARAERDARGVQAIVNYNFDDLLDEKLREEHVKCRSVLSGHDRVPIGTLACYHVHGLISARDFSERKYPLKAKGNFVFSEDEYHAEYSDPYKWSNMIQVSLLGRYTGLFVGLSLEDPNIRRLIDVTHRQYPDNPNYAILPRKQAISSLRANGSTVLRTLFEDVETNSFEKIGVKVLWVDHHSEVAPILREICGAPPTVATASTPRISRAISGIPSRRS